MSLINNNLVTNVNMADGGGGVAKPNTVVAKPNTVAKPNPVRDTIYSAAGSGKVVKLPLNAAQDASSKKVGGKTDTSFGTGVGAFATLSTKALDNIVAGVTAGAAAGNKEFPTQKKATGKGSNALDGTGIASQIGGNLLGGIGVNPNLETNKETNKETITTDEAKALVRGSVTSPAIVEQKTQGSTHPVNETKPGVIQITQADSDNVVNELGHLTSNIASSGANKAEETFSGALTLAGGIFRALAGHLNEATRLSQGTSNTARQGIDAMRNVELQSAKRISEEEIPNFRDLNDPNNRQLRDINAEYMAITSEDDDRSVNAGDKDTKEQKISSTSKIPEKKALTDITSSLETKEEKYDSTSSILTKELEDILKPSDIDSKIIDDFKDSKIIKLDDAKKEDKNMVVNYDDKSIIGGAASLKNIFKNGGEEEQKIKDSSLITPEDLASIVKNSTTDAQNINSSSSISGQVKLSDISGNTSKNVKRDKEEKAEGVKEETLAEATDALTDLGEVGSEHDIMGNELGKTIGDLGPAGDLGVADMMSSMASDVVSSEVGK